MRIVIEARPERMINMTFFDGIGNQIFPPMSCKYIDIVNIVKGYCDESDVNEICVGGPKVYTQDIIRRLQTEFSTIKIRLI